MKKTEQIIALVNDFIRKENNKVQGRVDKAMSEMFEHMEKLANQEKGKPASMLHLLKVIKMRTKK